MIRYFLTARDTADRLTERPPLTPSTARNDKLPSLLVDPSHRFQTIEGIGGAFTEASAVTFNKLGPESQRQFLEAYFDPAKGHGYTFGRTHINSCDFALGNYAYCETDGDTRLENYSIDRDRQALLPLIKSATAAAGKPLTIFASPWSPPAWMKTNGEMNNGGKLRPEYRATWAEYYVRFIQEYQKEGVDIWAVTVQNEPEAVQIWDSCIYTAAEEKDFIRDHLGPTLQRAGLGHVKIILWDHNRDQIIHRAAVAYNDPEASKYIWGTGFHWYTAEKFEHLELHHDAWPDKRLVFTEGCQEGGPHTGEWTLGERYARNMINDFNRWMSAWCDWNLLLDETGGPNHVGNLCSAPILADTKNDRLMLQSSYWYIGHIARFVRPGAKRILSAMTIEKLEACAFVGEDGTISAAVLNPTELPITFNLDVLGRAESAAVMMPPRSMATLVIPPE